MKVTSRQEMSFRPVALNLVLETEKELEVLRELFSYDYTVPETIGFMEKSPEFRQLKDMMTSIRAELDKATYK